MLNKPLIRKLYTQGLGYKEIGERFEVSKQRIHQIIKNYTTISPRWKQSKRIQKILSLGCEKCGGKAALIHHKDGDTHYNADENLMPLCTKCHAFIHKEIRKENLFKIKCVICGKELEFGYEIEEVRTGEPYKCQDCKQWEKNGKKHSTRWYQKKKNCDYCGKPFTEEDPYHIKNMHYNCYYKLIYKTNPDRKAYALVYYKEYNKTPERKEKIRKWAEAYFQRPEVKERLREKRNLPENRIKRNKYARKYFKTKYHNDPIYREYCLERRRQIYIKNRLNEAILGD